MGGNNGLIQLNKYKPAVRRNGKLSLHIYYIVQTLLFLHLLQTFSTCVTDFLKMSNNSSSPICWQSNWFFTTGENISAVQYTVILPIYATICTLGHMLCVSVFLKQAKNEKAYNYLIYLEVTECLVTFVFTLFLLTTLGSGIQNTGYDWYLKNYVLMWYSAHLAIPLINCAGMFALLINVSMAADRVFALMKPFIYKVIAHKKHQRMALTMSLLVSVGTTLFNVRLYDVKSVGDHFIIVVDIVYVQTITSVVLNHACNVTRMVGLLTLIGCNVSILHNFKKRMRQNAKMTTTKTLAKKHEERENTLILLIVLQSLFQMVTMLSSLVYYTAVYTIPLFNICDRALYSPLLNSVIMTGELGKTVIIVLMNRKLWRTFFKICCFLKYWKQGTVGSLNDSTTILSVALRERSK